MGIIFYKYSSYIETKKKINETNQKKYTYVYVPQSTGRMIYIYSHWKYMDGRIRKYLQGINSPAKELFDQLQLLLELYVD